MNSGLMGLVDGLNAAPDIILGCTNSLTDPLI